MNDYRINFAKLREIWRNPKLSKGAKVILMDLLLYGGVQGEIFPSQITLAKNHDYSVKHIRNLLKELREIGIIDWEKGGYSAPNNYYTIEELYCPLDELSYTHDRKYISHTQGNEVPEYQGNSFPPNNNHLINSPLIESKHPSNCINNCVNGLIFNTSDNTASYCSCPRGQMYSQRF